MSEFAELRKLPYRQWFPWLELFRAGGLAIGWPQLGISLVAVVVFCSGLGLLGWRFGSVQLQRDDGLRAPELVITYVGDEAGAAIAPAWVHESPRDVIDVLSVPWLSVKAPLTNLVFEQRANSFKVRKPSRWDSGLTLIWSLVVWSLFGTALCRAVAVQIANDRSETLPNAVRFAWPRWLSAIGATSIPAAGILVMVVGLIVTAWLGRLPLLGTPLLTLFSPLLLLAGVAIAFLAFLILLGWPFMVAAMGVEDCDGFGSLSRTYSFLTGRPAHAVWNAAVSAVYGGVLVALVSGLLTSGLLALSRNLLITIGTPERWQSIMNCSHVFAQGLLLTFAVSLFWSLATLNYLLLRQAVDGKPFDDIAPGVDEASGRRDLPVVGIPAADLPSDQRERMLSNSEAEAVAPAS